MPYVFCKVETESLHVVYIDFRPRKVDELSISFDRTNLLLSKNGLSKISLDVKVMN
jgi:hypothetical protein